MRSINQAGLELVKSFEGFRAFPYRDIAGTWTLGYGHTNGTGAGNLKPLSFPAQLANLLNAAGVNAHSNSFIGGGLQTQDIFATDSRVVATGSASYIPIATSTLGGLIPKVSTSAGNIAFTPTVNVDTFKVWYVQNTGLGSFSLDINGGSATTINSSGTLSIQSTTKTGALGSNTLNFKWVSGADSDVIAIEGYNSAVSSVDVMNAGWPSGTTANMATNAAIYNSASILQNVFAQDLTVIMAGINDWRTGVSLTTYLANMQILISAALAAGGDCLIVSPVPSNPGFNSAPSLAVQQSYVNALVAIAVSNNLAASFLMLPVIPMFFIMTGCILTESAMPISRRPWQKAF